MTEYQKIAIGLLGLTHPEVQQLRTSAPATSPASGAAPVRRPGGGTRRSISLLRAIKFAFAALLTGARAVPMGDNRQLTKELAAYGMRLRRCA
jgi:hypothetical protein